DCLDFVEPWQVCVGSNSNRNCNGHSQICLRHHISGVGYTCHGQQETASTWHCRRPVLCGATAIDTQLIRLRLQFASAAPSADISHWALAPAIDRPAQTRAMASTLPLRLAHAAAALPRPASRARGPRLPLAARRATRRALAQSHARAAEASTEAPAEAVRIAADPARPVAALHRTGVLSSRRPGRAGLFPGGEQPGLIIGFLIGLGVAGSAAYAYHVDEYNRASEMLLNAVDEIKTSTEKVRDYASKIEQLKKELAALQARASAKEDVAKLREELKRLYSEQNLQHLELKSHVWGIEQVSSVDWHGRRTRGRGRLPAP
ncbi:MAG: hypothetical protein BJ554DRAFT_5807, partial [Olpidium bornovanus]